MKDSVVKKVWVTTTKKVNANQLSTNINRALWSLIVLVTSLIVFSSVYFSFFTGSPSWTAILITIGLVLILSMIRYTNQGNKCWQFLLDAKLEMGKVIWPTRQETINSVLIVLVIVILSSVIIYLIGLSFMYFIQKFLG